MPAFYVQVLQVFIVKGWKCYEVLLGPCPPPKKKVRKSMKNMCVPDSCGRKMICKKECKKRKAFLFRKNGSELVDYS